MRFFQFQLYSIAAGAWQNSIPISIHRIKFHICGHSIPAQKSSCPVAQPVRLPILRVASVSRAARRIFAQRKDLKGYLKLQYTLKMDHFKCPVCNKKSSQPINLRCDHHPCFQCASQIISVDQQSTLETRYRIVCPNCHKKTITYDLRHLIINATQQDEDLFVTTKFINKKPEVLAKKSTNYPQNDKANTQSKRNSSQGIINVCSSNKTINVECRKHPGCSIQYFCEQCTTKNQSDTFFCPQCLRSHKHKVFPIKDALDKISSFCQRKRNQSIPLRKKFLEDSLSSLLERKESINGEFENLYKEIAEEFKAIYHYINQQYEVIKKDIKTIYSRHSQEIRSSISFAQKLKQSLTGLQKISEGSSDIETQVNFLVCFSDIELALDSARAKLSEKFEAPKISKKTSCILGSTQRLFQVQNQKQKPCSKPATPTSSARVIGYQFQNPKNPKNQDRSQNVLDIGLLKQNFHPLSPKNYLSQKLRN